MLFEVTAVGFNAEDDSTDDRVLWVASDSHLTLEHVLSEVPHVERKPLPGMLVDVSDVDYDTHTPDSRAALCARLRGFARN